MDTLVLIFQLPIAIVDGTNTVIDPLFDGIIPKNSGVENF